MRILLVEDEEKVVADIRATLAEDDDLVVVGSRDEAKSLLEADRQFDLIVCDLRIPPAPGAALLADEQHGLAVHAVSRQRVPGCPLRFFSGRASLDNLADALTEGGPVDLFGDGVRWALVHVHQKRDASVFVGELRRFRESLRRLDEDIDVGCDHELDAMTVRALRILARRVHATKATATRAGSGAYGMSGADTLAVVLTDDADVVRARSFVKIADHERIDQEVSAFDLYVPTQLAVGFTPRGTILRYGLQQRSAVSYVLAEGFDSALFTLLRKSPGLAVEALDRLVRILLPWKPQWRTENLSIGSMRRQLISDQRMAAAGRLVEDYASYEGRSFDFPMAIGHGDLHGGNVLVRSDGDPMLIDFGDVGLHWSAIDPITLELSLIFHPASPIRGSGWPTGEAAESFDDLDAYLAGCPVGDFVRKVRAWALDCLAGDHKALHAIIYAHATRQLKYDDTDHAIAEAFARGARSYSEVV